MSRLYNAISLNAAIFAAVCLASTMMNPRQGFVLVSLSAQLFGLISTIVDKVSCMYLLQILPITLAHSHNSKLIYLLCVKHILYLWLLLHLKCHNFSRQQ